MRTRNAALTVLVTWALILAAAFGVSLYRHDPGLKSWLEYVWGISFAIAATGALSRVGAVKGDSVLRTEGVIRTSQNRQGYIHADNQDAALGLAFGTIVMLAAGVVFAVSL